MLPPSTPVSENPYSNVIGAGVVVTERIPTDGRVVRAVGIIIIKERTPADGRVIRKSGCAAARTNVSWKQKI